MARHLLGDRDGLRPDQDMGMWMGLVEPMAGQGRAVRAGDQPCCGIAGAGTDSLRELTRGPGPCVGWGSPGEGMRDTGVLRALTHTSPDNSAVLSLAFLNNMLIILW